MIRRRLLLAALAALVAAAAVGLIGYRVFAPAEILTPAAQPYPSLRRAIPGVAAELPRAPLIVDGRLRVYAATRQVWADTPVGARTETTPYWSFRRWPQQVLAVRAAGAVVVSQWSDGELVAIDATTGRPRWRVQAVEGGGSYAGRRTGAVTVYGPGGLYIAASTVVLAGEAGVRAFDLASGAPLWTVDGPACQDGFTGPDFFACVAQDVLHRYDLRSGARRPDWQPPGPARDGVAGVEPLGCAEARSSCGGLRAGGQGWLFEAGGAVLPAPGLAPSGAWLLGDLAVDSSGAARDARTGAPLWTWSPGVPADTSPARVVGAEPGAVYLLTTERTIVVLDPENGLELSRLSLDRYGVPIDDWVPGHIHVRDRFVVAERLRPGATPAASDGAYYLSLRPVVLAGT